MFTKELSHIFTVQSLHEAFDEISQNAVGIDDVDYKEFKKEFRVNELIESLIKGKYAPEPLKKIEIAKQSGDETRPIALSSIKDKLVQRTLYKELNDYFNETFSNQSYAYRKDKSTINAINRITQFLNEGDRCALKTDIDNFFETINHDKLLQILNKQISDKSVTRLISLFLQMGGFKKFDYQDHIDGVHQGDIISPLLSNVYLDVMDKWIDKQNIDFVRYADDFVVLFQEEKEAISFKLELEKFLSLLNLKLGEDKTYISHIKDGFTFLGVRFEGKSKTIDNDRFQKSISKLHSLGKNKSGFLKYVKEVNDYLTAFKNYYLKIIDTNSQQYDMLRQSVIDAVSHKVYLSKQSELVKTKKEFRIFLAQIKLDLLFEDAQIGDKIDLIIARGYEKYLSNKSYKDSTTKIEKKKNEYSKKFASESTLHISKPGIMLGVAKNRFSLKEYGKVVESVPFDRVSRIIIEGVGCSISSDVIKRCADSAINIDFIDRDALAYASLITYKSSMTQTVYKQSGILNSPLQLSIAKEFIRGKATNQINYLKYLNKYHASLTENVKKMTTLLNSMRLNAKTVNEIMGYEGNISNIYWESIKMILKTPFSGRITQGAKDVVNSSLNYGYAILYGKVQRSLVYAGLSLSVSYLHSLDDKKPTLTFDMIEEFRTFIVDRTIFSMLNKGEPISLDNNGMLTKKSRALIAQNIKEKLGSYTMWKKESNKIENIIQTQCYLLAKVVNGESKNYKAFIGKY